MEKEAIVRLADQWRASGIGDGDMVLLHSDIRRTLRSARRDGENLSPETLLNSFLEAVGKSGTLLLPLFNFDFTRGVPFDIRSTPSQMGILTEVGRQHAFSVRTAHPIYSFAVLGAQREQFRQVNNFSGYGEDSPFALLHRNGGKIAVLDLPDQNSMTFYHYVEEALNVPYRYHKTFSGTCIDAQGNASDKTFGLFVRDLDKRVQTHVNPMGELLWQQGLYSGSRPNQGGGLRVIGAKQMYEAVAEIIRDGRALGLLYTVNAD
jgi:aminoglycoside 3-N-acetyltransferase